MPSVTRDEVPFITSSPTSKKRRRDDVNDYHSFPSSLSMHGSAAFHHNNLHRVFDGAVEHMSGSLGAGMTSRKILPLASAAKKQRTMTVADVRDREVRSPATAPRPAPPAMSASQYKRNHCHICGRRPMVLSDLDAYADCQGCGNRTCYVCIRQCLGWIDESACGRQQDAVDAECDGKRGDGQAKGGSQQDKDMHDLPPGEPEPLDPATESHGNARVGGGTNSCDDHNLSSRAVGNTTGQRSDGMWLDGHREMVCSRCCVEKGADGDVVCLGCLPYV